jgi:hypothetical protein
MQKIPNVVVELETFLRGAAVLWDDREREGFIDFIALHSDAGEIIPGTGGLRKIRWSRQGMGKRGGARVIYYYENPSCPVFLLAVYAKAAQENLSAEQKLAYRKLVAVLKAEMKVRNRKSSS